MISVPFLEFLSERAHMLCSAPMNGDPLAIGALYNSRSATQLDIQAQLNLIHELDKNAIEFSLFKDAIVFINERNLDIMILTLTGTPLSEQRRPTEPRQLDMLTRLQSLLTTPESANLTKLRSLLNYESTGSKLSQQYTRITTLRTPFIETCNDSMHSMALATNPKARLPRELVQCLHIKIHFIPIIKPHTDITLGDCSYLDTCHKLDSCRYLHYTKHVPQEALKAETQRCEVFNGEVAHWEKVSPWQQNGCVSNLAREILPPQWINCDVRHFNFTVLGKFAAVIADRE